MITVALATVAAMGWGAADYLGAKASRGASALFVVFASQIVALPVLALLVSTTSDAGPHLSDLAWGAGAGAIGLLGMVLLYRMLAVEGMALVAPISAVTVAVVPLAAGLLLHAAPGPLALLGVCCALGSLTFVNRVTHHEHRAVAARTLLMSMAAGAALGLQLVCLSQPGPGAGMWPLVGARVCSILCAAPMVLRRRARPVAREIPWLLVAATGILDTAAFAFYLFAMDKGLLSMVGPIVAMYPVATVALALAVDRERVNATQVIGLALGASALLLVAI